MNISYINMCKLNKNRMKKGMRERGRWCENCSLGELLDNNKNVRPLYIFKHVLKYNFVLFI